jgi:hypothetical protein
MRLSSAARLAVVAAIFCAAGCSSKNKGKIEGTKWSSQPCTVKGTTLPAGGLTLEFTKDGKVTYQVPGATLSGRYSLGRGDYVTLTFDQALAGSKTHREKVIVKGNTLTMIDGDGTSVTFDKVG